jgi:hypothetical protein
LRLPPRTAANTLKPSGYTPNSIPIYYVSNPGYIPVHACASMGWSPAPSDIEGVGCADMYVYPIGNAVDVYPGTELMCLVPSHYVQCWGAQSYAELHAGGNSALVASTGADCGYDVYGACPLPRFVWWGPLGGSYYALTGCNTAAGGPNEVWTVLVGGGYSNRVVTPDPNLTTLKLGSNLGSGHAIICRG